MIASHVARYASRIDDHLLTLRDDAMRRVFLTGQLAAWQARYAVWVGKIARDEETDANVSAFDFIQTLLEIELRLRRYPERAEVMS